MLVEFMTLALTILPKTPTSVLGHALFRSLAVFHDAESRSYAAGNETMALGSAIQKPPPIPGSHQK